MKISTGTTDQYIYFVALDASQARVTGLSSFTVYRSRNGGSSVLWTTPTINETDSTNMPGVYEILLDEDMTISSGNDNEEILLHISEAGMSDVTRTFELYRRTVTTAETITVSSGIISANTIQISGDSTAADNLEATYDGTGYTDDAAPATQAQVGAIGSGSAGAINFEATEDNASGAIIDSVVKVGTPTGTFANTEAEDGVVLSIADVANDIDWVLGFDIGGNRQATEASIVANVDGNADEMKVKVYDHVGAGWDIIGTVTGTGGTTAQALNLALLSKHTGTGSELGKVYIRFDTDSTTPSLLEIDKCLIAAVSTSQSTGYVNGQIWIDTADGTAGTEAHVNGVANNPVDSLTDAVTLSGSTKANLHDFHVSSDSTITLAANLQNHNMFGIGYTLDFAGFDCSGTHFYHASPVTGIVLSGGSDHVDILDSIIGDMTCNNAHFTNCSLTNATITFGSVASTVRFVNCRSVLAGSGTPVIDFGTGSANHDLTMSNYQNGIEIRNFNVVTTGGTDTMSLSGCGQLIIASTCDGGAINLRGQWKVTDNSGGAVTITRDDVATDIISILADTAEIGTAGAGLTNVPWNPSWDAESQSEVADALAAYNAVATTDLPTNFGSLGISVGGAIDDVTLVATTTTNTDLITAATIADAVLDEALSGHTTAGSLGKSISDTETDATAILVDTNELQTDWVNGGRLDLIIDAVLADTADLQTNQGDWLTATGFNTTTPPTVGAIADAVWDETQSGHVTAGTFGLYLDSEVSGAGGGSGWTSTELEQLRYRLNIDGTMTAPSVNTDLPTVDFVQINGAAAIETGYTPLQMMKLVSAAMLGKSSNDGATFRDITDSTDRIVATVDADGNRTAITYSTA